MFWANRKYYLHHLSKKNGATTWRCTRKKCRAQLKLLGTEILRDDHHICEDLNSKINIFVNEIKTRVVNETDLAIPKIYEQCIDKYFNSGLPMNEIPAFGSMRSILYRLRSKALKPSEPTTVE